MRVDDEAGARAAAVDVVAQDRHATGPLALAALRGDLVSDALADHLALELGEREEDVQRQAPHRLRRVELLRHGDERHLAPVEDLHQPHEVDERPAHAVDLVDHDAVHVASLDVGQEPLEGRALEVAAGEAAVVVAGRQHRPALGRLALDVRLRAVSLRVEGVVLLLEALLGRLARVDGAADAARDAGADAP